MPALAASDRGVLDLLGVTRQGRLVVIELKASEDLRMPVQAVDYWLRVRRLLQYFSREIQVTRIGLNENWRRGVKVVFRQ